jgi:hypothetical protein
MIKRNLFMVIIFVMALDVYAQNSFYIKELTVTELNDYEKVFLIFYKYGPFSEEYYAVFVIASIDLTELKLININTIERRQDKWFPPLDLGRSR